MQSQPACCQQPPPSPATQANNNLLANAAHFEEIECDCHGSRFSVKSGEVLVGPSEGPLMWYAVREEGGDVSVGPL